MTELRFKDSYQTLTYDFIKDVLVICPKCEQKAIVKASEFSFGKMDENDVRLVCSNCGHSKILSEKPSVIVYSSNEKIISGRHYFVGGGIDPFFHLPLWLSENLSGNLFWAYNIEHIEFLENHIQAKLRERNGIEYRNKSIGSRLPKWMTSKKNRELMLKTIEKLKRKN